MISTNLLLLFFIILNFFIVLNFSKLKFFHFNIDKPDKIRKLHSRPTPLAGGQIIFINLIIYWILSFYSKELLNNEIFFQNENSLNYFMVTIFFIFLLGFVDDKYNLKANLKFIFLFIIILTLLLKDLNLILNEINFSFYSKSLNLKNYNIIFTIFCFLVFLNAFNMFDGINLQSSLYSIIILTNILFFFSNSLIIKILIISLIFFSYLNYKNKSFLGDSGSLIIAFMISYFFIKMYNFNIVSYADQIVLYMLIPGLDLIRLFIIRIFKKQNPLSSDRNHIHHLLLRKYSLEKSLIILLLMIIFPIIFNFLKLSNFIVILLTIMTYSSIIIYLKQKK